MTQILDKYGMPLNAVTMADKEYTDKLKKIVIDLAIQTRNLTKKDIRSWRQAWQMAINYENPRRRELYNVYTDTDIDGHLSGTISQLNNSIKQRTFKIIDKKTKKEKEDLTELLEAEWFKDFLTFALESRYWGHSLIQLGDAVTVDGKRKLMNVELVPRVHVIPEYGVILREPGDEIDSGINYREGRLAQWIVEAGNPYNLGLYLKTSPHAISKKNMAAFWDTFGELFGIPIRTAKTSNTNPSERSKLEKMLRDMGAAAWGLFSEGTDIDIRETNTRDSYQVFDQRILRANSEMSKIVLTETMTTDDGSSYSQSKIHENMFRQAVEAEADRIKDIINNQLLPKLTNLGFPFTGSDVFEWDYTFEYTPEQRTQLENMILNHFEVDLQYFIDRYNIPITGVKERYGLAANNEKVMELLEKKSTDPDFFV